MAAPIAFESSWEKAAKRKELREAREQVLAKAKQDYERKERKKELARQRGEDTWMLPSVNDRIAQEQVKPKKEKKEKKKKEKKKKKAKKKNEETSSESESDSEKLQWVEKNESSSSQNNKPVQGPKLQRDDWMSAPPSFFPCISREELRSKKNKEKEEAEETKRMMEKPGTHQRELNPYWKDGGTGMPEEDPSKKKSSTTASGVLGAGDCGVGWWRKALNRCQEQAEEEGRTMEDVAADRYGSLKKLKDNLEEAERALREKKYGASDRKQNWRKTDQDRGREGSEGRTRYQDERNQRKEQDRSSRERYRERDRSQERTSLRNRDRSRSRSLERDSKKDRYKSRSSSRDRDTRDRRDRGRSRSKERDSRDYRRGKDRSRSRSRERDSRTRSYSSTSKLSGRFMKPSDEASASAYTYDRHKESDSGWRKKVFLKPDDERSNRSFHRPDEDDSSMKKRNFMKPGQSELEVDRGRSYQPKSSCSSSIPSWKKKEFIENKEKTPEHDSSDSDPDSSSSSESASEEEEEVKKSPSHPIVEILSEEQMNQLGAKILRAELMGDQAQADKLKAQLEAARKAKESNPTGNVPKDKSAGKNKSEDKEEDMTVLLTRTGRSGMTIPLPASQHEPESGKRRKKRKVTTHEDGKRARYFDDDDKFDLKTLVEREKMSTAEDQNMMFSRLAGRAVEKTDDEYQIDDVFMSRAAGQQSEAKQEQKDRAQAIFEHKKMSKALENCKFCFESIPKHLIIAIGIKVYLCLPNHKSMTDGHCLIVPMMHVSSGTSVDEDVWSEIQVFRKGLTRMFEKQDEDVVFMETVMNLNRHPHMVIECVPMPREVGEMSPIYFKKAIMEAGPEWAQNKKLVDLSQKDVRKSVPKGFPYFAVDFGLQGGFAHVIEDEKTFPHYFGREIVGGMLDLGPEYWRKPHKENFEDQRKKVLKFAEWWKPYDWTQRLKKEDSD